VKGPRCKGGKEQSGHPAECRAGLASAGESRSSESAAKVYAYNAQTIYVDQKGH